MYLPQWFFTSGGRLGVVLLCGLASACVSTPEGAQRGDAERVLIGERAVTRIKLSAVGDIMLGGSAAPEMQKYGYDHPFDAVREVFQDSHLVFGNLEGPLTDAGQAEHDKRFVFRSPPRNVALALSNAGFNIVSLANNHSLDYGVEGLQHTMQALDAVGIHHVGAGMNVDEARTPVIVDRGGARVAFLAYSLTFPENFWAGENTPGTAFGHEDHLRADVASAKLGADIVVVSFHWGREATTELRDYQRNLAHTAVDAGAVLVLGHHPHVLQGIERYKNGLILYSLGNFAFGSYSRRATRSVIAQCTFENAQLISLQLIPINVNNVEVVFQPLPLIGDAADEVIAGLQGLSRPLGTWIRNNDGVGVVNLVE